jgi:hypothetical protein
MLANFDKYSSADIDRQMLHIYSVTEILTR